MIKTCYAAGTGSVNNTGKASATREPGVEELLTELENLLPGFAAAAFRVKGLADRIMGAEATATAPMIGNELVSTSESARARLGDIYRFLNEKLNMMVVQLDRIY